MALGSFGTNNASKAELPWLSLCGWNDNVDALDERQFIEDGARAVPQTCTRLPLLERFPKRVREEADKNVRLHALLLLVRDRANGELGLPISGA